MVANRNSLQTKEKLLKQDLVITLKKTPQLRERNHRRLLEEQPLKSFKLRRTFSKSVKLAGLKEHMVGLELDPQGKSKAALIDQIKNRLGISRFPDSRRSRI